MKGGLAEARNMLADSDLSLSNFGHTFKHLFSFTPSCPRKPFGVQGFGFAILKSTCNVVPALCPDGPPRLCRFMAVSGRLPLGLAMLHAFVPLRCFGMSFR